MLSPTESTVGDSEHGDMGTWDDLQSREGSDDEDQENWTVMRHGLIMGSRLDKGTMTKRESDRLG